MINFYTIFHGNLAFSAIEEQNLPEVIDKCYFPLLDFIEETSIATGLELSAYSLEIINRYRPTWITRFKALHEQKLVELVGSGYMQIIGPLVPYEVNIQNQLIGLQVYQEILGFKPRLAYVNEQAFSTSMVDIYHEAGYQGIVMEWNNAYSKNPDWQKNYAFTPNYCQGVESSLPLLWTDSIVFQKFQRHIHGELTLDEYINKIDRYLIKGYKTLPIYTSDIEVFNYRPGRFETEAEIKEDEWEKITIVLNALNKKHSFSLPFDVLKQHQYALPSLTLTTSNSPILVKKQGKYSLSRWAACGRGATKINHLCYQYFQQIQNSNDKHNLSQWKNLLTYWGSDFRTHITQAKWKKAMCFFDKNKVKNTHKQEHRNVTSHFKVTQTSQHINISSDNIECHFLLNKGLCLDSVQYKCEKLSVGTVYHGDYDYIHHGADYYTGTTVIDSAEFGRVSDLSYAEDLSIDEVNEELTLSTTIPLKNIGKITKKWIINNSTKSLTYSAKITLNTHIKGSIRTGTITIIPQPNNQELWFECKNGGNNHERYYIDKSTPIEHHRAQSLLQSSQGGIGVTDGILTLGCDDNTLCNIDVHQHNAYPFVMLENSIDNNLLLTRIYFSLQELDDTLKIHEQKEFNLSYSINLNNLS